MDEPNSTIQEPYGEEEAVDEVLGENSRASDLRLMRIALQNRREGFVQEKQRASLPSAIKELENKLRELDRQVAALRQEEAIAEFVETSVRVTMRSPSDEDIY